MLCIIPQWAFSLISNVQVFPWPKIKPAVRVKLESIIADFSLAMPEEQVGLVCYSAKYHRLSWIILMLSILWQIPKMPNVDTFKFTEMKQRIFEQLDSYRYTGFLELNLI